MSNKSFRRDRTRKSSFLDGGGNDDGAFVGSAPRFLHSPSDHRGGRDDATGTSRSFSPDQGSEPIEATVKWFNPDKGFGFLEVSDGGDDAFLGLKTLTEFGRGVSTVAPGTTMTVRLERTQRGRQVVDVVEIGSAPIAPPRHDSRGPRSPSHGSSHGGRESGPTQEMRGTVKWFNADKGFGFVAVGDGGKDVFLHASVLRRAHLESLDEGQTVTMDVVLGQKGREARSVSLL